MVAATASAALQVRQGRGGVIVKAGAVPGGGGGHPRPGPAHALPAPLRTPQRTPAGPASPTATRSVT
eukprot:1404468-Rhodomonas_salina.2